jgi:hypothetical protein
VGPAKAENARPTTAHLPVDPKPAPRLQSEPTVPREAVNADAGGFRRDLRNATLRAVAGGRPGDITCGGRRCLLPPARAMRATSERPTFREADVPRGRRSERSTFREVDAWGLTHPGKVRGENQDHFFVGALAQGLIVDATSITDVPRSILHPESLASLAIVADGVGSTAGGGEAARLAVSALLASPTTLTLFLGLGPHAYLLQVGDSRCYIYMGATLTQITRDWTRASSPAPWPRGRAGTTCCRAPSADPRLPLGGGVSLTPGVRFARHAMPDEVRLAAAEIDPRWSL